MVSCVFIFAICLHAAASFPTKYEAELPLTTRVKPDGGFSRIIIRDYSINNIHQTSDFFVAAVTGVVRQVPHIYDEANGSIVVYVKGIELTAGDHDTDILVEYSIQLNETLLSCSQTTSLMNTSIDLFESSYGNEAVVVQCDHQNGGGLSLHSIYGIIAGGTVLCISLIVVLAVVAKKKYSAPKREYFYIRTQLYDRVLEVIEDENAPLSPAKFTWCNSSSNDEKKVAKVLVCDQASGVDTNQKYQEMKDNDHQLWYCDKDGFVHSKVADLALEIQGRDIIAASFDPTKHEHKWHFSGDHIVNDHTDNLVIDIRHSIDKDGAELCAYRSHGGVNQKWTREFV